MYKITPALPFKKSIMSILSLFVLSVALLPAQVTIDQDPNEIIIERGLGDQIFSFNVGTLFPLFSYNPTNNSSEPLFSFDSSDPRLSLGVIGTLRWGTFVTPVINLGADVTWGFNFGANGQMLSQFAPIQPRISAYLFRSGIIEVPLHLALGMNIMSYKEGTILTPLIKTGGSVLWNSTPEWAFGVNINYWIVPELYTSSSTLGTTNNRIGNFLEISASALYNF